MTLYDGLPLFDQVIAAEMKRRAPPEPPFVHDSPTSRHAAKAIRPHAATLAEKVFEWILSRGAVGATCDEIEVGMELLHQTASSRIRFLAIAGRLVKTPRRRLTRTGNPATVWVADDMMPRNGKEASP